MSATFECPNCKETLPLPQAGADRFVTCPTCWNRVRAPEIPPPVPPASAATTRTDTEAGTAIGPGPTPELPPPLPTEPSLSPLIPVDPVPYPAKWQATGRAALLHTGKVTRYALREARAIIWATASLVGRAVKFGIALGYLRFLEQGFRRSQLDLGEQMYHGNVGALATRESIRALDEQIEKERAAKRSPSRLLANRRELLLRLAATSGTDDTFALQGPEQREVQSRQHELEEQQAAVNATRAGLLPPSPIETRRVALGFGAVLLATVAFGLSGGSKNPHADPGADDAVAEVQSQSKEIRGEDGTSTVLTVQTGSLLPDKEIAVDLGGGVKLEMVLISAGEFLMGSPDSDSNWRDERPQHLVRITKPFYLGRYLVTQEQWEAVMGSNPSHFKGPKKPVEQVSWDDCQAFLDKLNAKTSEQGGKFQLPTEAQWEYACRAGSTTRYYFGNDGSELGEYAWYCENSGDQTHPVGEKKPNDWGLYDMYGNVSEWCRDWQVRGYYANSPPDDPPGPVTGTFRVFRGGSRFDGATDCRSVSRISIEPEHRDDRLGLRVSRVTVDVGDGLRRTDPTPQIIGPVERTPSRMLSLNLRLSDYMSKEPLLEGGPRTIETQVRSIAATFQRELDSAVSSNKPLVRMLALDKQRQRLAAQIPSLQAQLQEMKKDEFETTQQFEERRRPLQERLAQVQKELPSIEEALGAADTSAELRKVAASIVIPVRIYLPTESPTYDADRREIRCKVPPVKDNCECERREGSRRIDNVDRVIYTKCVLTLMFNSKAGGELLFQNIPDIQTAKKLKDCLELDNLFTLEKNTAWRKASGAVVDGLANVSYSCTVSDSTNLLRIQEPYLRTTELRCVIDFRKSVSVAMPDLSDDLSKLHISVEYLPGRK